jgi:hypothetical protein
LLYYIIDSAKEIFNVVAVCRVPKCWPVCEPESEINM